MTGLSPPTTSTTEHGLSSRLAELAGVTPSPAWLDACLAHLVSIGEVDHQPPPAPGSNARTSGNSSSGGNSDDAGDAVLHQILNADLRDVVRRIDEARPADGGDGEGDGNQQQQQQPLPLPAKVLRDAIEKSCHPATTTSRRNSPRGPMHDVTSPLPSNGNSSHQSSVATLPPNFQILVQAEECLDVSRNAETRYSLGPGSSSAPSAVGNQSRRLLKIVCSDGCYPDGSAYPPLPDFGGGGGDGGTSSSSSQNNHQQQQQQQHHSIVMMETSPVPSLSANSLPGIKLLLRSSPGNPLTVRHGIIQINPSNCTVLGGCVHHLIDVQNKAREICRKNAGVGVDPTVRALIGTDGIGGDAGGDGVGGNDEDGEDNDVGDGASGDVAPRAPPPPQQQQQQQQQGQYQPQQQQQQQQIRHRNHQPMPRQHQEQRPYQQQQQQQQGPMEWTPSPQEQQRQQQRNHGRVNQATTGNIARPTPTTTAYSNPYASGGGSSSGGSGGSAMNSYSVSGSNATGSAASASTGRAGVAATNPYQSAARTTATGSAPSTIADWMAGPNNQRPAAAAPSTGGTEDVVDLTSPMGAASPPSTGPAAPSMARSSSNAALSRKNLDAAAMDIDDGESGGSIQPMQPGTQDSESTGRVTPASTGTATASAASTPAIPQSNAYTEPLSFSELRSLLLRIKSDRAAYEQYEGKTFVVPCKLIKTMFDFRFDKIKGKKKEKKSKQYEFCITTHFIGTAADGDDKVSVRLSSKLIEPFYSTQPTALKKMHKEDKTKANGIASEGSTQVISEFGSLAPFRMRLLLKSKDFFAQETLPPTVDGKVPLVIVIGKE